MSLSGACVAEQASTELSPVSLALLVDTSGSMDRQAPGSRRSKWEETRDALSRAVSAMPGTAAVGLVFYPDGPNDPARCFDEREDVAIARLEGQGSAQRGRIEQALRGQQPEGGTPTHDAYRYALERARAAGANFVVLITDGTPTYSLGCEGTGRVEDAVDPGPLVPEASAAFESGVKTFVIGSPGSEDARGSLSRMAAAGGTAQGNCSHTGPRYCHFDMTQADDFAGGLRQALEDISGAALGCTYELPKPPSGATLDLDRVNVVFEPSRSAPELIARSQDARRDCATGWQYSADNSQIVLCGSTCDRVRSASGSITIEFGCLSQGLF